MRAKLHQPRHLQSRHLQSRHLLLGGAALTAGMQFIVTDALANPAGLSVAAGSATAQTSGSKLTVTTGGNNTVLNWQSFNIAAGETTVFNLPSAGSMVVNNIHDANASQIYGSLQANGLVILMNQHGFYFGPNSFVSVGGLVLTTANCTPPQNTGGSWEFNGPPPLASIVNYGQIKTAAGGSLFLIADEVDNHGTLEAPGGSIGLAAGQTVMLTERPDGRGMSMAVTLPQGSVNNYGDVIADGGTLALNAQVVNQNGLLQANSVREVNGQIELVGSDAVNLGAASQISAQGDSSAGGSAGGNVTVRSGGTFSDAAGSQIVSAGGANGGNGGTIEVSAPEVLSLDSTINAGAQNGGTAGAFILDPENITLGTTGSTSGGTTGIINGSTGSSTLTVNVNTAFKNITAGSILLEASGNITLATAWNLSTSTGKTAGLLTMEAGGNIIFNSGASLTDANSWAVTLEAGYNFTSHNITSGTGNIYLNGASAADNNGSLSTAAGAINLLAGGAIQLGSGSVTASGGNILWQAGTDITFYDNNSTVTDVNGGSLELQAGYNITGGNLTAGLGNIYLAGTASSKTGFLQTDTGALTLTAATSILVGNGHITTGGATVGAPNATGDISLTAGQNITVGTGYVDTTGGGSITAVATAGSINTGRDAAGYVFNTTGNAASLAAAYTPSSKLGGISTAAGGDVNLTAGQTVSSYLPQAGNSVLALTAGAGAFGPEAGNVTVIAGGDVTGNFMVANGTGKIYAGVQFDGSHLPIPNGTGGYLLNAASLSGGDSGSAGGTDPNNAGLALSLVKGGWNVAAAQNIYLQEVRNPNGDFDKTAGANYKYLFDYSAAAYVNLSAGYEVQLGLANLPRISAAGTVVSSDNVQVIYPPVLNITAGDGGVVLGTVGANASLTLFPSSAGSLTLVTSGPLTSGLGSLDQGLQFSLVVSDSSSTQYIGTDSNPNGNFAPGSTTFDAATPWHLASATPLYLNVGGDLSLINLTAPEAATIKVGGNFIDNSFQGMNLSAAAGSSTTVTEANGDTKSIPINPAVTAIDVTGDILYPSDYNPVTGAITTSFNGLALAGGGAFNITARTIDLGTSGGIESQGVVYNAAENYPLAQLFGNGGAFTKGADVTVTTTGNHTEPNATSGELAGDMDMTLSSIDSLFGGNITINASADLNAGQPNLNVNSQGVRGIYTSSGGDLNITAKGNINVFGSRLTTFDGGNITVESLDGDINAGSGSSSPVSVSGYYEDPATLTVYSDSAQIPFSGIAALTFPDRKQDNYPAPPPVIGNILVEAPNGTAGTANPSIASDSAGILQLPINNIKYPDAQVLVLAGYELQDGSGHRLTAADITTGTPVLVAPEQYISVGGSGVIASNAKLEASGGISGLIFAFNNINIVAQQNVNVTALGEGNVNVSSSAGTISGTIIGVGGVSVGGGASVDASLISANVSGSSSGQTGLGAGTAAAGTATAAASDETTKAATATLSNNTGDSDDSKKKGKHIALAQKVSRVTVLLPGKK